MVMGCLCGGIVEIIGVTIALIVMAVTLGISVVSNTVTKMCCKDKCKCTERN